MVCFLISFFAMIFLVFCDVCFFFDVVGENWRDLSTFSNVWMSFDTLSLRSYLPACFNSDAVRYRDFDRNPEERIHAVYERVLLLYCYPGFFALRALKSFDRIVFLEIALYYIVKLKRFKKACKAIEFFRSQILFLSLSSYLHFPRICQSSGTCTNLFYYCVRSTQPIIGWIYFTTNIQSFLEMAIWIFVICIVE